MDPVPRRYPLILNPNARSAKARRALRWVMSNANRFTIYATNHAEEARELAISMADNGEEIVVAAGGDGTLNNIVRGLAGSDTALGILPTGTMNVFARELGFPMDDLDSALKILDSGRTQDVDLFQANGHVFMQMAGVGLDAKVIDETSWDMKKALGPLAYLVSAVKVLGERPARLTVTDDQGNKHEGVSVVLGNGELYGGQFKLFPQASNCDRLLDVIVFKDSGYRLVAETMRGLALGKINVSSDMVEYFTTTEARIETDGEKPVPFEVDGELASETPVEITCSDYHLKVFAPEGRSGSRFEEALKQVFFWNRKPESKA